MTTPFPAGRRIEPPLAAAEGASLLGFLDRQRSTFFWKCSGLDAAGLAATLPPSTMTLGGLLKHLAHMEDELGPKGLLGLEPGEPWASVGWDAEPEWDWTSAAADTPAELEALWRAAVDRSRAAAAEATAGGLDALSPAMRNRAGEAPTLRYVLSTLHEEYARHLGHADLLRESVDGRTGEDPPD